MSAIIPLQRWKRDDWVIPCVLNDKTGSPINLTGCIIVAESQAHKTWRTEQLL